MINFLHLSALLSLTSALCLQRNAKKMNGANISPSFYSFFIFCSIFVFILLLLPSFLSFFLFPIILLSYYPILFFFLLFFSLSVLLVFIFVSLCLSLCSYSHSSFSVPPFLFIFFLFLLCPFSEECDLQQKFHIDNVKHLPKFYAHFLKARFLFET